MNATLQSPFSLITEPTAVRRIILREGLDNGDRLPPDGWSFEQFESDEHRCLSINHREANGEVSHRIVTAHKSLPSEIIADCFADVTVLLAGHKEVMFEVEKVAMNLN